MGFEISLSRFFDSRKGEDDKKSDEELLEKFRKVYNLLTEDVDYSGTDTIKYNYESCQM